MARTPKLWIGIGLTVALPAFAQRPTVPPQPAAGRLVHLAGKDNVPGTTGVVGGETYLRDGGISDTRTRFSRDMLLLLGHLEIASEAVESGAWDAAKTHVTTSSEDIRTKLEPYMRGQGVPTFEKLVAALVKAIHAKNRREFTVARQAFTDHAARGSLAVKKFQTPYLRFQARAIVETLKAASSAYDSAVTGQAVSDAAEYHDSRGFLLAARRALAQVELEMSQAHPDHVRDIKRRLAELATAWRAFTPPTAITMNAEVVALLVSQIEDDAAVFWQDK